MSKKFKIVLFDCDGVAAGATVFGYAPSGDGAAPMQVGRARIFIKMADFLALL